jgi:predicted nucleic acid-binding protein
MRIFVDSPLWLAMACPSDTSRHAALEALARLGDAELVTTADVLVEVLAALAKFSTAVRGAAAAMVRKILESETVAVVPQSHESFLSGLALLEERLDKGYNLTDCISMRTMRDMEIAKVLTFDDRFRREGYTVLMNRGRN